MRFLLIFVLLPLVGGIDLCHDPRTSDLHHSCATTSFALLIPSVHGNPYHALHDTLWAVAHYLRTCARRPLTLYVPTRHHLPSCEDPDKKRQPDWGFCVAYILVKAAGASVNTTDRGPVSTRKRVCHTTETVLRSKVDGWPETFRGLNWFVDYGDEFGHSRLEENVAAKAFRHIRSVVRRFYGLNEERELSGDAINILVYDRADARRRRWANAKDVVKMVETLPRARVRYITRVPHGLGKQVQLFGRTDLLIAPHGAAMANTVFMKEGSGVLEIAKECEQDWVTRRGMEWTGWHAEHVGLNLEYVDCQRVDNLTNRVEGKAVEHVVLEMVKGIRQSRMTRRGRWAGWKIAEKKMLIMPVVLVGVLASLRMPAALGKRLRRWTTLCGSGTLRKWRFSR